MRKYASVAILGCLLFSPLLRAAEPDCGQPDGFKAREAAALRGQSSYVDALSDLVGCIGNETGDSSPIVVAFHQAIPKTATDRGAREKHALTALQLLLDFANARVATGIETEYWKRIATRLHTDIDSLQPGGGVAIGDDSFLPGDFWRRDSLLAGGEINPFGPIACTAPPAACPVYDSRKEMLRVSALVQELRRYADADSLTAHLKDARMMNSRWSAYFHDTLPQFWWEVGINGWRMQGKECREDASGIPLGFCKVPESQWVVLHPAAVVQWVNGAQDANDLKAALAVEIFGINWWQWQDGNAGFKKAQRGIGLAAAYADRGGSASRNLSGGLIFHYGSGYNLAVTTTFKGKQRIGIFFNTNLAEKLFAQKEKYIDYLKALKKPGALTLLQ